MVSQRELLWDHGTCQPGSLFGYKAFFFKLFILFWSIADVMTVLGV